MKQIEEVLLMLNAGERLEWMEVHAQDFLKSLNDAGINVGI